MRAALVASTLLLAAAGPTQAGGGAARLGVDPVPLLGGDFPGLGFLA